MEHRRGRGGCVVDPPAARVLNKRRCRGDVDIVAHEGHRAELEQRQIGCVELQLLGLDATRAAQVANQILRHHRGRTKRRHIPLGGLDGPHVDRVASVGRADGGRLRHKRPEDARDVLTKVVVHNQQTTAGIRHRRHHLVTGQIRAVRLGIHGARCCPEATLTRCRQHNASVTNEWIRPGSTKSPLCPRQIHAALIVDRDGGIRVGAEAIFRRARVKRANRHQFVHIPVPMCALEFGPNRVGLRAGLEFVHFDGFSWVLRTAAASSRSDRRSGNVGHHGHDRVWRRVVEAELPPRHMHHTRGRVDGDRRTLIHLVRRVTDADGRRPGHAAVVRARKHNPGFDVGLARRQVRGGDLGVGHIHRAGQHLLGDGGLLRDPGCRQYRGGALRRAGLLNGAGRCGHRRAAGPLTRRWG